MVKVVWGLCVSLCSVPTCPDPHLSSSSSPSFPSPSQHSGRLIILPKKSWHVWNQDNREKVLRDERLHREEQEKQEEQQRYVGSGVGGKERRRGVLVKISLNLKKKRVLLKL